MSVTEAGVSTERCKGSYREAANGTTHSGINDHIIIHIEEVAVLSNPVVVLLAVIRHFGPEQVSTVFHNHAVLLHLCLGYQPPTMNPRLHQVKICWSI